MTKKQAEANLRRDSHVAARIATEADRGETPVEHVMNEAETHVREEGKNLLTKGEFGTPKTIAPA